MLELIRTPELAAEVTLQPIDAFGLDAAIIFSDILPPLVGMGLDLDFVGGVGPRIANRIERAYDVDLLGTPPAEETMAGTLEAIRLVARELGPRGIPVIGFCGAPFTLASYAIEGGSTKEFARTKAFMLSEPAAWHRLMSRLVTVQVDYLKAQVARRARRRCRSSTRGPARRCGRPTTSATSSRTTRSSSRRSRAPACR